MAKIRIGLGQINATVGDIDGNRAKIEQVIEEAVSAETHLLIFPELALSGYPPEDLLLKTDFIAANRAALDALLPATQGLTVIIGCPHYDGDLYNAAAILHDGKLVGFYHKRFLPNYAVFDEDRYFAEDDTPFIFELPIGESSVKIGVSVCEDIWYPGGPPAEQAANGAELLVNISASPYKHGKIASRERMLATRAADTVAAVAFCNLIGGQDELIFDGSSLILNEHGDVIARAPSFEEALTVADLDISNIVRSRLRDPRLRKSELADETPNYQLITLDAIAAKTPSDPVPVQIAPPLDPLPEVYTALVLATRDYVHKNGFKKILLGLSGGIDSSIVAAIAADALGPDNVVGISMPSRYSSEHSKDDAEDLANNLGIGYEQIAIEPGFKSYMEMLGPLFEGTEPNTAEENIQARIRGNLLMAMSNKFGWMVLTTGNKSEMSVGYATLYGDMAGGFAVIKDVSKLLVYELCRYRNDAIGLAIPENVLTKPPSAELKPDQFDSDSLPPYDILDAILELYVEDDYSSAEIIAQGFEPATVNRIITLVNRNEYKRRQAPPGPRVTSKAFGKDRRLPITSKYK